MENLEKKEVDDIIAMLDSFVAEGRGHINVDATAAKKAGEVNIAQVNGTEAGCQGNACSVPTLHQGLDRSEEGGN